MVARNGGHIDLPGLVTILSPLNDERLFITAAGGTLFMPSLTTINNDTVGGSVFMDISDGGAMTTGGWDDVKTRLTVTLTNQDPTPAGAPTSSLTVLGNLHADDATININHPNTKLDVDGSILLGTSIELLAPDGTMINVAGDCFCHAYSR